MGIEISLLPGWQAYQAYTLMKSMSKKENLAAPEQDEELMLRVGTGDEAALRVLIEKWKNPLINFFYRSLRSLEQSEDLAQMVYIRLYQTAPNYQPKAKFSTFIFHIARRLLINEYRRQKRKPLESVDPADLPTGESGRSALNVMEIEEAFAKALKGLPENQRTAILLLKQQELSYEEIAEVMGCTKAAVKSWIFRARQQLKLTLQGVL